MKIMFNAVLRDRHGTAIREPDQVNSVPGKPPTFKDLTLADICCVVLDSVFEDEAREGLKPKLRRAELIEKITEAEKTFKGVELLKVDIEMIRERIAKRNFPASLTAAAVKLLDTALIEEEKEQDKAEKAA